MVRAALVLAAALAAGCASMTDLNTVPVEVGLVESAPGDSIAITEVRGSHPTFVPGGNYRIRGRWTLASRDAAELAVWNMNGDCAGNTSMRISRGSGDFELTVMILSKGYPHLSLFPSGGGNSFGSVYFGTGDSVWRTPFAK